MVIILFILLVVLFVVGCVKKPSEKPKEDKITVKEEYSGKIENPFIMAFVTSKKSFSLSQKKFIAEHYKYFEFGQVYKFTPKKKEISAYKKVNPDMKILVYHSLVEIKDYDPKLNDIEQHEDWFLHCENDLSKKVIFKPGVFNNYLADIGNPEYRKFWIERTRKVIEKSGYDGVFIDVASSKLTPSQVSCKPKSYSDEKWADMVYDFLREIKKAFPDKIVIFNGIRPDLSKYGDRYIGFEKLEVTDGGVTELFESNYNSRFLGKELWKKMMNNYIKYTKQGKIIAVLCWHWSKNTDKRLFCDAAYLLIRTPNLAYSVGALGESDKIMYPPELSVPLGKPVSPTKDNVDEYYDKSSGLYVRKYTNGLVLLNIDDKTSKKYLLREEMYLVVPKGEIYVGLTGEAGGSVEYMPVNEVIVKPLSGAILIKKKA